MDVLHSPQSQKQGRYQVEPEALLSLWLPADPQSVSTGRHAALHICTRAGISEDDCAELDLALGEALANAVLYNKPVGSAATDETHDVGLCAWDYHGHLIFRVYNRRSCFNPPQPPYQMPAPGSEATRGRGLPLMQSLMDAMIICREAVDEGGTSVYLVKNIPPH